MAEAEFVGTEECEFCHDMVTARFAGATHSVLVAHAPDELEIGCESCHGPGSVHVESGGEAGTIVNPKNAPETCYGCHIDVRGDFALPFRHPVANGPLALAPARMACNDCHDPHEGDADAFGGGPPVVALNEGCVSCHPAQRGPYVFEHEAMREGCTTCHAAHGSPNPKMLRETSATLCLSCHFQEQPRAGVVLIGGQDHSFFLSQGTCFSAGCHEAVHGSQVDSNLRF